MDFLARYKSRIRATVYGERRVRCALLAARVPGAGAEGQEDTLTLVAGFDPTPEPLKTALDSRYQENYGHAVDAAEERALERALERVLAERDAAGGEGGSGSGGDAAGGGGNGENGSSEGMNIDDTLTPMAFDPGGAAAGAAAAPAGAAAAAAGVAPEERQCTAADLEKLKGQGLKQKHAAGTRGSSQTTREAQRIWKVVNFCIVRVRWRGARRSWLCETCGHLLCKQFRDH